jgi:hypothetical protein
MNDKIPRYPTGAVVRWNGSLWIVAARNSDGYELLSFTSGNCIASPSMRWPYVKSFSDEDGPADHSPDPIVCRHLSSNGRLAPFSMIVTRGRRLDNCGITPILSLTSMGVDRESLAR